MWGFLKNGNWSWLLPTLQSGSFRPFLLSLGRLMFPSRWRGHRRAEAIRGKPVLWREERERGKAPVLLLRLPIILADRQNWKVQNQRHLAPENSWAFVFPSLRPRGWAGDLKRPFQPHHSTNLRVFSWQKFLEDKINPLLNQRFPSLHVTCQGNFSLMLMWCGNLSHLPSLGTSSPEIER